MLEVQKIWSSVLEEIKKEIPESSFEPWVLPLVPQSCEDGIFTVLTGQSFSIQILKKFNNLFEEILTEEIGQKTEFQIVHDNYR